jgi:hypothetical protein
MAVIKKPLPPETPQYNKLVAALTRELQRDQPTGPKTAPQIIEEEQHGKFMRVTVIWNAWKDVTHEDRGRIIMDVYEKQRPADVTRITVALGLTHAEAERLGVHA